jgi:phosphoglycerate dehydrogenase-like enzyme
MAVICVRGDDPSGELVTAVTAAGAQSGELEEADALVWAGGPVGELVRALAATRRLRWVQLPSAGVEQYAELMRTHSDVVWTCSKEVYADSVAEHALALALALRRGLHEHARATSWHTDVLVEPLLGSGEIAVLLGGGGIARRLAELLAPYRLEVRVVRRSSERVFDAPHSALFASEELHHALTGARMLFVTLPLTDATTRVIGAPELRALASGAIVVNVGRGGVIDTTALTAALVDGHLRGAGLDVTDPEPLPADHALWSLPGVLITSHTSNPDHWRRGQLARLVTDNTRRFLAGQPLLGRVDLEAGY